MQIWENTVVLLVMLLKTTKRDLGPAHFVTIWSFPSQQTLFLWGIRTFPITQAHWRETKEETGFPANLIKGEIKGYSCFLCWLILKSDKEAKTMEARCWFSHILWEFSPSPYTGIKGKLALRLCSQYTCSVLCLNLASTHTFTQSILWNILSLSCRPRNSLVWASCPGTLVLAVWRK